MTTQDDQPHQHDHRHGERGAYPLEGQCTEVVRSLYLYLDNELDPENHEQIQAHIDACSPCLEAFSFEAEFKTVIATAVSEDCPGDVRQRVLDRLRQVLPPEA